MEEDLIKIMVLSHKDYWMPDDSAYIPMYVGKKARDLEMMGPNNAEYLTDGTGDNISSKNPYYCELTGIYWAWKNLRNKYVGLVHYRRHFTRSEKLSVDKKREEVLSNADWEKILSKYSVVVPKKRKYYIETNYSHYIHAHHAEGINVTRSVIAEKHPDYLESFDKVMKRTWAHMFNMFVMRKDLFDEYCDWLFSILFAVEKRIDITSYDQYESRIYGFVSELLLDVWLECKSIDYIEQNVSFMEKQNWFKKGGAFLKRKFCISRKE